MDGNNNQFGQPYQYPYPNPYAFYGMPPQGPVFDERAAKKHFSDIGMSYFVFWVITIVATNAVAIFMYLFTPEADEIYLVRILASILPMYLIGAPICWLLMQRVPAEAPERHSWNFWQIIGGFVAAYGFMRIADIIGTTVGTMIESFFPDAQAATNEVQELVLTGEMWVNVLVMVMIGPVVEELLFRKLLCDRLRAYGDWVTIIVTGMMFGVFHGNITQGVYAFVLGAFLAYVYLRTGNILMTIGYHIAINFMGSVVPLLLLNNTDVEGFDEILEIGDSRMISEFMAEHAGSFFLYGLYMMLIFALMIGAVVILIVTCARNRVIINPGRLSIPSGKRFSSVILNLGMILFLLGGLIEILLSTFG